MKRVVKLDNVFARSAQIDPKYNGKSSFIRVDVPQGGEGPIPHFHVLMENGKLSYPRIDKPEYSSHHKDGEKMNSKEREEFDTFLRRKAGRVFIQSFITDEVKEATNYQHAVDVWVETYGDKYGGIENFKIDQDGFPVQPDYTNLPS